MIKISLFRNKVLDKGLEHNSRTGHLFIDARKKCYLRLSCGTREVVSQPDNLYL